MSVGDPLQNYLKEILSVKNHGVRVVAYRGNKFFEDLLKPVLEFKTSW